MYAQEHIKKSKRARKGKENRLKAKNRAIINELNQLKALHQSQASKPVNVNVFYETHRRRPSNYHYRPPKIIPLERVDSNSKPRDDRRYHSSSTVPTKSERSVRLISPQKAPPASPVRHVDDSPIKLDEYGFPPTPDVKLGHQADHSELCETPKPRVQSPVPIPADLTASPIEELPHPIVLFASRAKTQLIRKLFD